MARLNPASLTNCVMFVASGFLLCSMSSCGSSSSFAGDTVRPVASAPSKPSQQVPTKPPVDPQTPVVPPTKPTPETPIPPVKPVVPPPPKPPQEAVTKGSFTVWANPPNPKMFESYEIHVRVKLPANTFQYNRMDLSGTLYGTDGYQQTINVDDGLSVQRFNFTPGSGYAELIMPIPGASGGVSDTLTVNSRLIKESQTIKIVFGNSFNPIMVLTGSN